MITRRAFSALSVAGLAVPRAGLGFEVPAGQRISCRVMRKGSDIGRASYDFEAQGDALTVRIMVDLRVKFGFVTMFRYVHANTEQWQGSQLRQFESHTDNNGVPNFASAHWNGSALEVRGTRTKPYTAPARALGTTYWNPRTLTDPLINAQDGRLMTVSVAKLGPSEAVLSTGKTVAANEYSMTGELHANLWFDTAMVWQGMQYYVHDGSILTYERL